MSDLLRRQRATTATLARYRGRTFCWRAGVTCVHLARFHLRKMGHKPETLPRLRSIVGARRALKDRGWADVAAMLDAQAGLMRIAPAQMLTGDLAVLASADGIGAIFVCVGPHKMIGWREDAPGAVVLDLTFDQVTGAWRV